VDGDNPREKFEGEIVDPSAFSSFSERLLSPSVKDRQTPGHGDTGSVRPLFTRAFSRRRCNGRSRAVRDAASTELADS